jgi:hypothetical protein
VEEMKEGGGLKCAGCGAVKDKLHEFDLGDACNYQCYGMLLERKCIVEWMKQKQRGPYTMLGSWNDMAYLIETMEHRRKLVRRKP